MKTASSEVTVAAINLLGKNILCKVTCTPLTRASRSPRRVILEEIGPSDGRGLKRGGARRVIRGV
jgi:hypothetical protein